MIILTKPVFEKLIEHLIQIEETADHLAEFYFPDSPEDREEIRDFFRQYIKWIDVVMEQVTVVKSAHEAVCPDQLNTFPFVVIHSEVDLETSDGRTASVYRVMQPDSAQKIKNGVTYLSPVGKALLLRKVGSPVDLESPDGQPLRIKTIRLFP